MCMCVSEINACACTNEIAQFHFTCKCAMSALTNGVDRSPLTITGQLGSARREPFFVADDFGLALEHFYVPGVFEYVKGLPSI